MSNFKLYDREFLHFSHILGNDPLQVQGAGGNTSIKNENYMWVKASGKELSDSLSDNIFVPVNINLIRDNVSSDNNQDIMKAVMDKNIKLRPSIETTFHACLNWSIVAHTHSVSTLVHAISEKGIKIAKEKLNDMPLSVIKYIKPGIDLTKEIMDNLNPKTQVFILKNHGLICCGNSVKEVSNLIRKVELRLKMPIIRKIDQLFESENIPNYKLCPESWIAFDDHTIDIVSSGSYYPDHVVFLGPKISFEPTRTSPVFLKKRIGIFIKSKASKTQKSMLQCLSNILLRLPLDWVPEPIGEKAEAELLDWDAEKYRKSLSNE